MRSELGPGLAHRIRFKLGPVACILLLVLVACSLLLVDPVARGLLLLACCLLACSAWLVACCLLACCSWLVAFCLLACWLVARGLLLVACCTRNRNICNTPTRSTPEGSADFHFSVCVSVF